MASLFCCNFLQIYFYHLVKYIYENKNKDINKLYDYSHFITIIDGEGDKQITFKFSIKILFMRLLNYIILTKEIIQFLKNSKNSLEEK